MNLSDELTRLTSPFSRPEALIEHAIEIFPDATPAPYQQLLAHPHHMTVTMEQFHHAPMMLDVLQSLQEGEFYCRKIVLSRADDGQPVLFGMIHFHLETVPAGVRQHVIAGQIPLGRILIDHHVERSITIRAILRIVAGPELAELLQMPPGEVVYGRLAMMECNGTPAIDLLEISAPLPLTKATSVWNGT